jgi:hypothetical protein
LRKIIEYYIVSNYSAFMTTEHVNEMIKDGWQPYGLLTIFQHSTHNEYTQAMVKYEDVKGPLLL